MNFFLVFGREEGVSLGSSRFQFLRKKIPRVAAAAAAAASNDI